MDHVSCIVGPTKAVTTHGHILLLVTVKLFAIVKIEITKIDANDALLVQAAADDTVSNGYTWGFVNQNHWHSPPKITFLQVSTS